MFGGEQLWECFSCGHSFTGGKRQDCCLPALQPPLDLQLVPLAAVWKAAAGV